MNRTTAAALVTADVSVAGATSHSSKYTSLKDCVPFQPPNMSMRSADSTTQLWYERPEINSLSVQVGYVRCQRKYTMSTRKPE